jgi:RNA polymerase sigma factor (sigma-70 family)
MPGRSEQELVAAVRRGEDRAFEELFARYRGRIAAYIGGMVGDHGRAEDITQEVFISALRRLRDTERPIAFKPWIYEIAKNACIDEHRRARRAREVPLNSDEDGPGPDRDLLSRDPSPDAAIESKQRLDDLRGAFGGLSESHHKILVLRELEGLSYSEIGARMRMSRPVVESTLFRARRRLSEEYQELVSGRRCERIHELIDSGNMRSLRALGIRQRRQLARHLAHCQPCRRHARMAGLDDSVLAKPGLVGKIAALLPFPLQLLRWRRARVNEDALIGSGSHSFAVEQSLQTVGRYADQLTPLGAGRAVAAAAALAIAGAGGGLVTGLGTRPGHRAIPHHTIGASRGRSRTLEGAAPRLGVADGGQAAGWGALVINGDGQSGAQGSQTTRAVATAPGLALASVGSDNRGAGASQKTGGLLPRGAGPASLTAGLAVAASLPRIGLSIGAAHVNTPGNPLSGPPPQVPQAPSVTRGAQLPHVPRLPPVASVQLPSGSQATVPAPPNLAAVINQGRGVGGNPPVSVTAGVAAGAAAASASVSVGGGKRAVSVSLGAGPGLRRAADQGSGLSGAGGGTRSVSASLAPGPGVAHAPNQASGPAGLGGGGGKPSVSAPAGLGGGAKQPVSAPGGAVGGGKQPAAAVGYSPQSGRGAAW